MLKKSIIRSLYILPVMTALILFSTHLWIPDHLIAPPSISSFEPLFEPAVVILPVAFYSFILPNKYEIELGLVNGYGTLKLALTKVIPVFVFSLLTVFAAVAFYRYEPYYGGGKTLIPVFVPDNYRIYMYVSVFVTLLFFSSVYFFMRVLTRNCYLPIIVDLTVFGAFEAIGQMVQKGYVDIRMMLIDPFISTYIIGDTVPNAFAEKYRDLSLLKNAWTFNRLIFLSFSLVILAATVFLLRREKLHRGIGE